MLRYFWNHMRKRARGERGFTLIELVVVLAILGILIALAVPRYLGARRRSYAAEARNILQEIKTLEWAYWQQFNTFRGFTADDPTLGWSTPTGARFAYSAVGADATDVTLIASGNATETNGISLQLVLNSNGSSTLTETF
ncbi:MAG: prepilin-type N-terminal cleavage/methylation domain-containing protein [Armatimonadota bacterium]|nr:prepilin-type N-terminal cleavage/methylation domain-containing protein [Armatimonadota bacterium]